MNDQIKHPGAPSNKTSSLGCIVTVGLVVITSLVLKKAEYHNDQMDREQNRQIQTIFDVSVWDLGGLRNNKIDVVVKTPKSEEVYPVVPAQQDVEYVYFLPLPDSNEYFIRFGGAEKIFGVVVPSPFVDTKPITEEHFYQVGDDYIFIGDKGLELKEETTIYIGLRFSKE
jgi:hypothetical protein